MTEETGPTRLNVETETKIEAEAEAEAEAEVGDKGKGKHDTKEVKQKKTQEEGPLKKPPKGVHPFHLSDEVATRNGLKPKSKSTSTSKSISKLIQNQNQNKEQHQQDRVRDRDQEQEGHVDVNVNVDVDADDPVDAFRKTFATAHALEEIRKFGFHAAFHPVVAQLRSCQENNLTEFTVVSDPTSCCCYYGDDDGDGDGDGDSSGDGDGSGDGGMYLLLYTKSAMETFQTSYELELEEKKKQQQRLNDTSHRQGQGGGGGGSGGGRRNQNQNQRQSQSQQGEDGDYELTVKPYEESTFTQTIEEEIAALDNKASSCNSSEQPSSSSLNTADDDDVLDNEEENVADEEDTDEPVGVRVSMRDQMFHEAYTQNAPLLKTNTSQTIRHETATKSIQYKPLQPSDFGFGAVTNVLTTTDQTYQGDNDAGTDTGAATVANTVTSDVVITTSMLQSIQRMAPLFEEALFENEHENKMFMFHTNTNYSIYQDCLRDIPQSQKGDVSIFRNDDDTVKAIGNYTDLLYSKGRIVHYLDVHPIDHDVVGVSVSIINSDSDGSGSGGGGGGESGGGWEDRLPTLNSYMPAYIIVWKFGHIRPLFLLKAPMECSVFRFNPNQPHLIVGGCRNGTVLLWDTSIEERNEISPPKDYANRDSDSGAAGASSNAGSNSEYDEDEGRRRVILPVALSSGEHGHKQMVSDLCWLPPHIQVNTQGQLLDERHIHMSDPKTSCQFFTASGDGQILFWDVRHKDIMAGKLPHVAKVKQSKQSVNMDSDYAGMKFVPIFRFNPKGNGGLSHSRVCYPLSRNNSTRSTSTHESSTSVSSSPQFKPCDIMCASEEGDVLIVNWRPKSDSDETSGSTQNDDKKEFPFQAYANRPIISLCQSNFFKDFVLTVNNWNFHIWYIVDGSVKMPVFESPIANSFITGGDWSPTRPGVIYISKADGSMDVWDFVTDGCYSPSVTIPLIPNGITTMKFTSSRDKNIIAFGDKSGSLHIFELPRHLVEPYPNESR